MTKTQKFVFVANIFLVVHLPFIVFWSKIPNNILNSNSLWGWIELIGFAGAFYVLVGGIALGIMGIKESKKMEKFGRATKVMSIINLCAGVCEVGLFVILIFGVVVGSISV